MNVKSEAQDLSGFFILKGIIMKANELRIGNLVNVNGILFVVDTLSSSNNAILISRKVRVLTTPLEEVDPIPLTKKWFTIFGYEHHTEALAELYDLSLEYLGFPIEPHADDWVNMWSKMAVPEFQNWWKANTGEELKIEL